MFFNAACVITLVTLFSQYVYGHNASEEAQADVQEPKLMTSKSANDEKSHIEHHMEGVVDSASISHMSEDELRFLYFKMHDSDNNNRLDGCELIKSLLHFHVEEHKAMSDDHDHHHGTTRIFGNEELSLMIDPIFSVDDKNLDGFIDYPEFVSAQKHRGF